MISYWDALAAASPEVGRSDADLAAALSSARDIATHFTDQWAGNPLVPEVRVELTVGGDDRPLFVFSLSIDLAEDLDADEYPMDEIGRLMSELRASVYQSPVARWSLLVTAQTKVGAGHE